jgi:hypothetical protein
MHYKLSKNEWLAIGNKAGWLKSAKKQGSLSECIKDCPDMDVDLRQECKDECWREFGDTAKKKKAAEIKAFEKTAAKLKLVKTFPAGSNGLSAKIYRDSDNNSYILRFFENGKHNANADYDSEDLQEVIGTAEYSISHYKAERPNEKTAAGPDSELYRKLQKIYGYVANEANDISDNQWKKWSISVDAGMSSDDEETKELAKTIKIIVDDFNSGEPHQDESAVREGDDDRYYSGSGESIGDGPDDDSYTRYLDRG